MLAPVTAILLFTHCRVQYVSHKTKPSDCHAVHDAGARGKLQYNLHPATSSRCSARPPQSGTLGICTSAIGCRSVMNLRVRGPASQATLSGERSIRGYQMHCTAPPPLSFGQMQCKISSRDTCRYECTALYGCLLTRVVTAFVHKSHWTTQAPRLTLQHGGMLAHRSA